MDKNKLKCCKRRCKEGCVNSLLKFAEDGFKSIGELKNYTRIEKWQKDILISMCCINE